MRVYYPTFYDKFNCRASRCAHSCCRGWEIDIDEETAKKYLGFPPPLGERLRDAIAFDGETYSFRLTGDGRCPFLNGAGLCDIIAERGKDALCEICREHPRFYAFIGDSELRGLGLSCEEATALLLGEKTLRFTDGENEYDLPALIEKVAGKRMPRKATFSPPSHPETLRAVLELFSKTEPIDEMWTREIDELRRAFSTTVRAVRSFAPICERAAYERIFQYILYRQLDRIGETSLPRLTRYAAVSACFIFILDACGRGTAQAARRFSEQIEYSAENTQIIINGILGNTAQI